MEYQQENLIVYKELYQLLFRATTDAIQACVRQDHEEAIRILIRAQRDAETRYLE